MIFLNPVDLLIETNNYFNYLLGVRRETTSRSRLRGLRCSGNFIALKEEHGVVFHLKDFSRAHS